MKYLRRLIWYVTSRLFIICCVLGLMITAFYFTMNATNIYIILKDGMAKRAQVIMMGEDDSTLGNYFASTYLARDGELIDAQNDHSIYQSYYNIKGIDHRLSLSWVWCWPWEDSARATVTESVPAIDGKAKSSSREALATLGLPTDPKWNSAEYSVVLSRENGQWHIKNLTLIRNID